MKFLRWISVAFIIQSCSGPGAEYIPYTTGTIIKVQKEYNIVYILVEFPDETHGSVTSTKVWFVGSDTCRAGQQVKLR